MSLFSTIKLDTVASVSIGNTTTETISLRDEDALAFRVGQYIAGWDDVYDDPEDDSGARIGFITDRDPTSITVEWGRFDTDTTSIPEAFIAVLPNLTEELESVFENPEQETSFEQITLSGTTPRLTINLPDKPLNPGIPELGPYGAAILIQGTDGTIHRRIFADLDGDGDVDGDDVVAGNYYGVSAFQWQIRPRYTPGNPEYGRVVFDALTTGFDSDGSGINYIQSGRNFAGTTYNDLAFTRYGSPSFHWGRFDESQNGYFILGKNSGQVARARLHAYDTISRIGYFESGATSMFVSLHALNTTAFDTVGVGATDDDLTLRAGGSVRAVVSTSGINVGASTASTSTLQSSGSFSLPVSAAATSARSITSTESTVQGDTTSSAFSLTLPTAVGISGRIYTIKRINSGANDLTVATTSSQTIDGSTTYALTAQWKFVQVQSNGANWIIIASN